MAEASLTGMRGRCLCGAVRFVADIAVAETHVCHCDSCRRWTGSALLAVSVQPDAISFEGVDSIRRFGSSDWAERAWCADCGSTLYYRLTVEDYGPRTYEMSLGLFETPEAFPLTKEIYIDRKPATYAFAGARTRLTKAEFEARLTDAGSS